MSNDSQLIEIAAAGMQQRYAEAQAAAQASPVDNGRSVLEAKYGQVWTTDEMREEFEVEGFSLGLVVVRRKRDGQRGSLEFGHSPRFYYSFSPA